MSLTRQLAKHIKEVHFGCNWTAVNLKDQLSDVDWMIATTKIQSFNTIATLAFHINYYISAVSKVLEGEVLNAKDEYSFNHPPITSQDAWQKFLDKMWSDAENFTLLIEKLPDSILSETFIDEKYGTYFRNLNGILEHSYYHLGQIVLLKKLIAAESTSESS